MGTSSHKGQKHKAHEPGAGAALPVETSSAEGAALVRVTGASAQIVHDARHRNFYARLALALRRGHRLALVLFLYRLWLR